MVKLMLQNIELSDIKQVVEEVLEINLQRLKNNAKEDLLTLLTRENTAKLLCISLPTLSDWTKRGIIKAHRIGNRVLYKIEDVNSALTEVKTSKKRGVLSC